jgi:hypothetical protein
LCPILFACHLFCIMFLYEVLEVIEPNKSHNTIVWTLNCGRTKMTSLNAWLSHRVNYKLCQHHQFQKLALHHQMKVRVMCTNDAPWGGNVLVLAPQLMTKQLHSLKYLVWGETLHGLIHIYNMCMWFKIEVHYHTH